MNGYTKYILGLVGLAVSILALSAAFSPIYGNTLSARITTIEQEHNDRGQKFSALEADYRRSSKAVQDGLDAINRRLDKMEQSLEKIIDRELSRGGR